MTRTATGAFAFGLLVLISACSDRPSAEETLIEVCRPDNVVSSDLGVAELRVPHDQLVARVHFTEITGEYGVSIHLSEEYAREMAQITRENLNQPLVLSLDDEVVAEPVVQTPILDGRILISGNYTRSQASEIVARLSGPCPPPKPETD